MIIDEIRNSKFNFQLNIITTLIFGNQYCLFQELTVGPLLSLSFPSTMIYKNQTGKMKIHRKNKQFILKMGVTILGLEISKITFSDKSQGVFHQSLGFKNTILRESGGVTR